MSVNSGLKATKIKGSILRSAGKDYHNEMCGHAIDLFLTVSQRHS